jgi:hypothetical protein
MFDDRLMNCPLCGCGDVSDDGVWVSGVAIAGVGHAVLWRYSPPPVVGLSNNGAARDPIISVATAHFDLAVWGRVTKQDNNTLTLNDGAGPISVVAAAHGLSTGDYAGAEGSLENTRNPPTLTSSAARVRKLN